MNEIQSVVIVIAEDDAGHARLIQKNLGRVGLQNPIKRFENGQQVLDFFFDRGFGEHHQNGTAYLLLMDIRMPQVDGVEALRQIKEDANLRKLPVIMLTTADDPREVERCHLLGCNGYLVKPVDYEGFAEAITRFGKYVSLVSVPPIDDHL